MAGSRNVAAGIGFYGAALAFYDRGLARGHDVIFVKHTRIEVATTPDRSTVIKPNLKSKIRGWLGWGDECGTPRRSCYPKLP
ncbi:MAG: hypothetical protein ACR2JE_04645 [Acidobacteriaceae bacterium]